MNFLLQSLGTRNSSLANTEVCMLLYSFCLVYFVFEANFQVQALKGLYSEGLCNVGRGGGAYIWKGSFSGFYGISGRQCW